ncbi:MAG: sensor histidine kinase [Leptospirillia bacterium]
MDPKPTSSLNTDTPAGEPASPFSSRVTDAASTGDKSQALAAELCLHCSAESVLILTLDDDTWRVMGIAGPDAPDIHVGDIFSLTANPSLSPDYSSRRPDLPAKPEPFVRALGTSALGDWMQYPVVSNGMLLGAIHLFTGWNQTFSGQHAHTAAIAARMAASFLGDAARTSHAWDKADAPDRIRNAPQEQPPGARTGKEDMAVMMSILNHDLRSPLNAIMGFCELMGTPDTSPEQTDRYREMVSQGANQLSRITDDLVKLGRMVLGVTSFHFHEGSLAHALNGLAVDGELSGDVRWDTEEVMRVLQQLVAYVEAAGGLPIVRVDAPDARVSITIGDKRDAGQPADPTMRCLPVQLARQVALGHGGKLTVGEHNLWFKLELPRNVEPATPGQD